MQEIDAYWLQRRISKSFEGIEANESKKLAEEVFESLQVGFLTRTINPFMLCGID